jgi:alpha-1,3-rhamnosyl/mannosyltransferase
MRIAWEQTMLPVAVRRDGVNVLLNPGFTAPLLGVPRQVTVFHDLQHKRHPENFRWFDLPFWNYLLAEAARKSNQLIAVSAATANDLREYYQAAKNKVTVVPHGVEMRFFEMGHAREESLEREKVLLCVSTLHPHKNLRRLLGAFHRLRGRYENLRLVLAGLKGFHTDVLEGVIRELSLEAAVTITGWIPREELYGWFERAYAFVYPSEFEGFGMPVSEALAAGIPVACSDIPPLREIAGEDAVYFGPSSEEEMLGALERVLFNAELRERLRKAGPRRVARMSWNAAAHATLEVLKKAARPAGEWDPNLV